MIGSLTGKVSHIFSNYILLNVSGVGYQVFLPQRILATLALKQNLEILIHTYVREDNITLFGFLENKELEIFLQLNKVSGVGAKTALNILGIMSAEQVIQGISLENKADFTQISGIGPKAAQRIINELKDKVTKLSIIESNLTNEINNEPIANNVIYDAVSALENLGYQKNQIINTVKDVCKTEDDLSAIITKSLQILSA
jgi:Holliday junction DNA helicase RuvA